MMLIGLAGALYFSIYLLKLYIIFIKLVIQFNWDHSFYWEIVDLKLHYHIGAIEEFIRLFSGLRGISPTTKDWKPSDRKKKKKRLIPHGPLN